MVAGDLIGANGEGLAVGMYVIALTFANRQLTDGRVPARVVHRFRQFEEPERIAAALVTAGLWDSIEGGYLIHDYHDFNYTAAEVNEKRKAERDRRKRGGHNSHANR